MVCSAIDAHGFCCSSMVGIGEKMNMDEITECLNALCGETLTAEEVHGIYVFSWHLTNRILDIG